MDLYWISYYLLIYLLHLIIISYLLVSKINEKKSQACWSAFSNLIETGTKFKVI